MNVYNFHDNEMLRQQKNLTNSQKRTNTDTREGVVVNNFIKDTPNLNDKYDTLVISNNVNMPDKLYEKDKNQKKTLIPISSIALGVMGAIAAITSFIITVLK